MMNSKNESEEIYKKIQLKLDELEKSSQITGQDIINCLNEQRKENEINLDELKKIISRLRISDKLNQ